jgi:hypothetical protein
LDTDTNLDTYIRSEDGIDLDSRELDTESDVELDVKLDAESDAELDAELDVESNAKLDMGLDIKLDFKAKEILKDITELKEEGPVKLNHTSYTKKLWKKEGEI